MLLLIFVGLTYLFTSIPSAFILCKLQGLPDPREMGSGNPGASNIARLAGRRAGLLVLLGDALKPIPPLLIAKAWGLTPNQLGWIALSAIIGHMFPLFFRFRGGKGVATALGALTVVDWHVTLIALSAWFLSLFLSRYVSLASVVAAMTGLIAAIWLAPPGSYLPIALIAVSLIGKHHTNLKRLLNKTEPKLEKS